MYYLITAEGLWKLAKDELIKDGWLKGAPPDNSMKDLLGEDCPSKVYYKKCKKCGKIIYLNFFVQTGQQFCSCHEPLFSSETQGNIGKKLRPFRKKEEPLPVSFTFSCYNNSTTAGYG